MQWRTDQMQLRTDQNEQSLLGDRMVLMVFGDTQPRTDPLIQPTNTPINTLWHSLSTHSLTLFLIQPRTYPLTHLVIHRVTSQWPHRRGHGISKPTNSPCRTPYPPLLVYHTEGGMVLPGFGDAGDRLFCTPFDEHNLAASMSAGVYY